MKKISSIILLGLLATISQVEAAKHDNQAFERVDIELNLIVTQPVIPARLDPTDSASQLLVVGHDQKKQLHIVSYQMESSDDSIRYVEKRRQPFPNDVLTYDLLKSHPHDKLLLQTNNEILSFDLLSGELKPVVKIAPLMRQNKAQFIAQKNFARDLNGDDLDDIIITGFEGTQVYLQQADGQFTQQSIALKPRVRFGNGLGEVIYTEFPIHSVDVNANSQKNIMTLLEDGLAIYSLDENSKYPTQPEIIKMPVDVSPLNWWEKREVDGESPDQSQLSHRTLIAIKDLNHDQMIDLVIRHSQSGGVFDRKSHYEIFLGKLKNGKLTFDATPNSQINIDGGVTGVKIMDINNDGKSEIIIESLEIGISKVIGALLSGSIDQAVEVYELDEDDNYKTDAVYSKDVELNFSLSSGRSGNPVVEFADFDNDGIEDFLYSDGDDWLKIHWGNAKPSTNENKQSTKRSKRRSAKYRFFSKKSTRFEVDVPDDGEMLEALDVNADNKDDILIRYGREDKSQLRTKIILFLSK